MDAEQAARERLVRRAEHAAEKHVDALFDRLMDDEGAGRAPESLYRTLYGFVRKFLIDEAEAGRTTL